MQAFVKPITFLDLVPTSAATRAGRPQIGAIVAAPEWLLRRWWAGLRGSIDWSQRSMQRAVLQPPSSVCLQYMSKELQ